MTGATAALHYDGFALWRRRTMAALPPALLIAALPMAALCYDRIAARLRICPLRVVSPMAAGVCVPASISSGQRSQPNGFVLQIRVRSGWSHPSQSRSASSFSDAAFVGALRGRRRFRR
jgi:hypothetical protein